jgi:hypothetical protein
MLGELKMTWLDAVEESTIHGCTVVEPCVYVVLRSLKWHTAVVRRLWPSAAKTVKASPAAARVLELELRAELFDKVKGWPEPEEKTCDT